MLLDEAVLPLRLLSGKGTDGGGVGMNIAVVGPMDCNCADTADSTSAVLRGAVLSSVVDRQAVS